ncbi:tRNA guanosine(34) transglycosylase Tgt [Patescibacteria group bacterium]|nr:tRNA guanosine(34) transglycosylase Tgt [Patescibacteria group bacterium]
MISFTITKRSKKSRARLGILKTPHGTVQTPAFVPVATQAAVKALTSEQVMRTKTQILISNTFHLHIRPGEKVVKAGGGIQKFMNLQKPFMTDSGGFQVFSLGFGKDFGMGKILSQKQKQNTSIQVGQQPKLLKITEDGVLFRAYTDGREMFLGPKESIAIQQALGADIILAFDECTSPIADHEYTQRSLEKTHRWAKVCLKAKTSDQALYGIVQGGKFKDLRIESAQFIGGLPFDGFAIGGEFGDNKAIMSKMLRWTIPELPDEKPRHLLGIGYLEDMPKIIAEGVDTFDCIVPTHYARRGVAFTSRGELELSKQKFLNDRAPIDRNCGCEVCQGGYTRSYLTHLLRAKEIAPLTLITIHNLFFFNTYVERLRAAIAQGKL